MVDRKKGNRKKTAERIEPITENDLIGMKDICAHMQRSTPTIMTMIRDMGFPAVKVGGIWESNRAKIAQWREDFYG